MNAPLPHVNRTALWTAVSVIAGQHTLVQLDSIDRRDGAYGPLAVVVSPNGTTLNLTGHSAKSVAEYTLADRYGRRLQTVRRRRDTL